MGVAFALVVLWSGSAQAILTHEWNFEEPNGTPAPQVHDTVGIKNGNFGGMTDADRSADVPANIAVVSTRSLNFGTPNSSKYVDVYNAPTPAASYLVLKTTNDWTLSLWYKGTDSGGTETQRMLIGAFGGSCLLELGTGGKVSYDHLNGTWGHIVSTVSVNNDAWHNITLVNHANETADLYVDAALQGLAGQGSSAGGSPFNIATFMSWGAVTFTSGKLDDVRIYDNSLTAPEVSALLAQAVPEPSTVGLVALAGATLLWRRKR